MKHQLSSLLELFNYRKHFPFEDKGILFQCVIDTLNFAPKSEMKYLAYTYIFITLNHTSVPDR